MIPLSLGTASIASISAAPNRTDDEIDSEADLNEAVEVVDCLSHSRSSVDSLTVVSVLSFRGGIGGAVSGRETGAT